MEMEKSLVELCNESNIQTSSSTDIEQFVVKVMAPNGSSDNLNLKPIDQINISPLSQINF